MTTTLPAAPISALRQRLLEDMNMRRFSRATQHNYVRDVGRFATFLGRPPDTATADDLRRFQVEQRDAGIAEAEAGRIGRGCFRLFFNDKRVVELSGIEPLTSAVRLQRLTGRGYGASLPHAPFGRARGAYAG